MVNDAIEVAQLVNGEVISARRLSKQREWREAAAAVSFVGVLFLAGMGLVVLLMGSTDRVLYAPTFFGLWISAGVAVSVVVARRALTRARRYMVGAGLDADAFASAEIDLVRRRRAGYELGLVPGMTGSIAGGRAPLPVESLVKSHPVHLALSAGTRAEVSLGTSTFVIRCDGAQTAPPPLARAFFKPFARTTLGAIQVMALASLMCATRLTPAIGEKEMRSAIPPGSTPWETEKLLRAQAQRQARSLHRCFDVMPLECQRQGYVGIGLSLSREGEIRSNWIARSTFGKDCPVEQCMADVVATWFFEPLPESMRVILPVQVLRTDRPIPAARASAAGSGHGERIVCNQF
jgi:hypothetical protein